MAASSCTAWSSSFPSRRHAGCGSRCSPERTQRIEEGRTRQRPLEVASQFMRASLQFHDDHFPRTPCNRYINGACLRLVSARRCSRQPTAAFVARPLVGNHRLRRRPSHGSRPTGSLGQQKGGSRRLVLLSASRCELLRHRGFGDAGCAIEIGAHTALAPFSCDGHWSASWCSREQNSLCPSVSREPPDRVRSGPQPYITDMRGLTVSLRSTRPRMAAVHAPIGGSHGTEYAGGTRAGSSLP